MADSVFTGLEQRVLNYIRDQKMIAPGTTGIVAVSGGADSICLLNILSRLSETLDTGISVCHVMHGIRGEEAERDAEYVRQEAERLGITCRICERDVPALAKEEGLSLEEAGRKARYSCLEEYKEETGADWIALAHQREDQVETVLFHLLRGTGLRGLRGIRPIQGDRIRPLLEVSRGEIEIWLAEQGIGFCTDSTNLESDYSRNKLRNRILPELREINAGVDEHFLSLAKEAEELYDIQETKVEELRKDCICRSSGEPETVVLPNQLEELTDGENTVLGELILREMERLAGQRKDLTRKHISAVRELFGRETGKRLDLPYGMTAIRTYEGVELRKDREDRSLADDGAGAEASSDENEPMLFGKPVRISVVKRNYSPGEEIPDGVERVLLDAAAVQGEPILRKPKQGDMLTIHMNGGKKPLARFFTDRKVPAEQRKDYPVVADDAGILWVVGLRLSEHCKVTEQTTEVYEIEVVRG